MLAHSEKKKCNYIQPVQHFAGQLKVKLISI